MMNVPFTVRAARPEDKEAILAFCRNTFSWGDYIPKVWDRWLADEHGKMFVGLVGDQPVGMQHVALLEDGVGWMEGMRVHPDYRRRGLASALDAAGRSYARACGCALARLATARDNIAARKMLEGQGYSWVAQYGEWTAKPARGRLARLATDEDLTEIIAHWRDAPCQIVANTEWRWEKLSQAHLADLQGNGILRVAPGGFAVLDESSYGEGPILRALGGDQDAMIALARSMRAEAKYRGYELLEAMIVDDPQINQALKRAGFKCEGGMFVYEQAL